MSDILQLCILQLIISAYKIKGWPRMRALGTSEARHFVTHFAPLQYLEKRVVTHDELLLDMRPGERIYVKSVSMMYICNETDKERTITLKGLEHEDIHFTVPANVKGMPPQERDALIYQAQLVRDGISIPIIRYLGYESAITQARTSAVMTTNIQKAHLDADFDVFAEGDPLLVFVLENRHLFVTVSTHDIILLEENVRSIDKRRCYAIRKSAVRLITDFFQRQIATRIHYVTQPEIHLISPPDVLVVIAIDYVLITPAVPSFTSQTYKIK